MPGADLPFSRAEYERRLALVRSAMAGADIDVLFVEDPSNMAWLTGYEGWSFYVHQGVVVFHDADPVWWGRSMDGNGAVLTVWMEDERVVRYGDHYIQSTERHPMQHLAGWLADTGHGASRIGVELENYYFSAKAYLTLRESLPDASLVDATALVNWQRGPKSEEEIVFMRRAARFSERIVDAFVERIEPGLRKNDLIADLYAAAIGSEGDTWGDYAAIVPLMPSGRNAEAPHLTWDGHPFVAGEGTFLEASGCYRRYHAPCCRTVFLGTPPDAMLRAEAAVIEGVAAGLEAARPGNTPGDIARAFAGALQRAGIERSGRCGYPIGLSYPPDWGERTASIRPEDATVLKAGMTFHFMPGIWMDGWGLEITEAILIREDGPAECLCDRPRKLFVKP